MEPIVNQPEGEEVITPPAPAEPAPVAEPVVVPPGAKTPPELLLKSLQEEREKNRKLEQDLLEARKASEKTGPEVFSDEGKILDQRISQLDAAISAQKEGERIRAVQTVYPAIVDKADEFETYRNLPENVGMPIETAAKAFVVENDLLVSPTPRKGLERETGGERVVQKVGRTPEEIDRLRVDNYRQYVKELKAGTLVTGN